MRRLTSMREFLLDALQDAEPQERVVQRLASLLSCTVALFGVDGRLLHASGPVPPGELWDAVTLHAKGGAPEVRGTPPAIAAVRDRELVAGWLIVVRRSLDSDVYARPLVEMTAALLSTLAGVQRISAGRRRAEHAAFVSDLLAGAREDEVWRHRAAELGLELGGPVALRAIAAAGGPPDALAGRLDAALAAPPALRRLTAGRGEAAVAVVQAPDAELRGRLDELYRRLGDAAIAVGRRAATVHELRDSIADALRSVTGEAGRAPRSSGTRTSTSSAGCCAAATTMAWPASRAPSSSRWPGTRSFWRPSTATSPAACTWSAPRGRWACTRTRCATASAASRSASAGRCRTPRRSPRCTSRAGRRADGSHIVRSRTRRFGRSPVSVSDIGPTECGRSEER